MPQLTATPDVSHICDLRHSLWQHHFLNPLREAGDEARILKDASWVLNPLSHNGNSSLSILTLYSVPFLEDTTQGGCPSNFTCLLWIIMQVLGEAALDSRSLFVLFQHSWHFIVCLLHFLTFLLPQFVS